jgi:nucleotide-binding universal stress UspA family protein
MFNNILVPLDGSELAEGVLAHVQAMAEAFAASVTLLGVCEPGPQAGVNLLDWHLRLAETETYLRQLAAPLQYAGLTVTTTLRQGGAAERIVEYAAAHQSSLIILSSHGRGGASAWNVSHIAQKVLQRGTNSILLIRAGEILSAPGEAALYRRIMLPLDGSRRAESVLPVATALARHQRARLLLVHVTTPPFLFHRLAPTAAETSSSNWLVDHNRAQAARYFAALLPRLAAAGVQTLLPVGDSVPVALHELAEAEDADLVLLSAHGHSAQSQWPYGSVVHNFIGNGAGNLLIVQDLPQPLHRQPADAPQREALYRTSTRPTPLAPLAQAGPVKETSDPMKRKTVFPHRTVKMREDFLEWARRQSAVQVKAASEQPAQAETTVAPGLHAWADDGGALPGAPDDRPAAPRRQSDE